MDSARETTRGRASTGGKRERADLLRDVQDVLAREPLLADCCIGPNAAASPRGVGVLFPEGYGGLIDIAVEAGVITLRGEVPDLGGRRIAAYLASRVPGCRDVVNELQVAPARPWLRG
jgi:hypothetical protein